MITVNSTTKRYKENGIIILISTHSLVVFILPSSAKPQLDGLVLFSVNPATHPPPTPTRESLFSNISHWMLTNLAHKNWKTTSIVWKVEDDLNFFGNGRRPQFLPKWKTTSIFWTK
jgi:hypothetical protein